MIKFFKEFFQLTPKELKGAFVLLFLIVGFVIVPRLYFYFQKPEVIEDKEFLAWAKEMQTQDSIAGLTNKYYKNENFVAEYFKFDPNTVSIEEMKKLGIDGRTANVLDKFRKKGAKFFDKEDLLRVYGFDEELYSKLEKYIVFPENDFKKYDKNDKTSQTKPFPFDPNTVTYKEMMTLGFDGKTAAILIKYRNKGAKFYSKTDMLKIFGFTEELYSKIEDYIIFPEKENTIEKPKEQSKEIPTLYIVDINKADSVDFIKLKGIGGFYAKTIIEYRTKLGGFYKLEQLKEAYGISEEVYAKIEPFVVLENPKTTKININTATFGQLIRHPYMDKQMVNDILKLQKNLGGFLKIEDLKSYNALTEAQFEKLKYYLKVE